MKLSVLAGAAFALGAAFAEDLSTPVTLVPGGPGQYSASFGATHSFAGAFTDTFTFSQSVPTSFIDGSLLTIGFVPAQNIDFSSADLNGTPFTLSAPGLFEFGTLLPTVIGGTLVLTVRGVAGGTESSNASYSSTLNVNPVPELGTYAMLLTGLGVVGFVARRRKAS